MASVTSQQETPHALFTFVTLKQPVNVNPMSHCVWTLKWPVKVNQGQRSRYTFINCAMVNISVNMHLEHRSNRQDDTGPFPLSWLEMISSRSSKVKCFCGFWKAHIDFPIVFHSNHMLISHHKEGISDFTFVTLKWPLKVNQGQR